MLLLQTRKPLHSSTHPANPSAVVLSGWCPSHTGHEEFITKANSQAPPRPLHHSFWGGSSHWQLKEPSRGCQYPSLSWRVRPFEDHWPRVGSKEGLGQRSGKADGAERCSSVTVHNGASRAPEQLHHSYDLPKLRASSTALAGGVHS